MKKGVVIEVNERYVTLLTPDGQFLKTENVGGTYELGEEMAFFPSAEMSRVERKSNRAFWKTWKMRASVAIAFVLLLFFTVPNFYQQDVYAYMTIDINPSFELELDEELHVLKIEPLNDEAHSVLLRIENWKDQPIKEVTNQIIAETEAAGYLQNEQEIFISTVVADVEDATEEAIEEELEEMKEELTEKDIVVTTVQSDIETRKKAKEEGVSTGHYLREKMEKDAAKQTETPSVEQKQKVDQQSSNDKETTENMKNDTAPNDKKVEAEQKQVEKQQQKEEKKEQKEAKKIEKEEQKQAKKEEKELEKQLKEEQKERQKQIKEQLKEEKKRLQEEWKETKKELKETFEHLENKNQLEQLEKEWERVKGHSYEDLYQFISNYSFD
ncbi:anti-sigma factor domain-containing protein [Bacillus kexueae]|uniref:anti-sigma-I factor RsgI family protein n=1 Tax=Aeribacillus kexueae TaxID=2078952 RepID=UPI001FAFB291